MDTSSSNLQPRANSSSSSVVKQTMAGLYIDSDPWFMQNNILTILFSIILTNDNGLIVCCLQTKSEFVRLSTSSICWLWHRSPRQCTPCRVTRCELHKINVNWVVRWNHISFGQISQHSRFGRENVKLPPFNQRYVFGLTLGWYSAVWGHTGTQKIQRRHMSAKASQITGNSTVCLFSSRFRLKTNKTWSSVWLAFVRRIHRWAVDSPHEGSSYRKRSHVMYEVFIERPCIIATQSGSSAV